MGQSPRNRSSPWRLLSVTIGLCVHLAGCSMPQASSTWGSRSGRTPPPVVRREMTPETPLSELVRMAHGLLSDEQVRAAWRELERRKDPNCVPLLLDALLDEDAGDLDCAAHDLIAELGDERCFPFLVPIADRYLCPKMTGKVYLHGDRPEWPSLDARRTIYFIVEPEQREKWDVGSSVFAPGATAAQIEQIGPYKESKAAYDRVNAWYRIWRLSYDHTKAPGYRKAVQVWKSRPPP